MEFINCYEFVKFIYIYIITFKSLLYLVCIKKVFISSDDFIVEIYACFFQLYFIYSQ